MSQLYYQALSVQAAPTGLKLIGGEVPDSINCIYPFRDNACTMVDVPALGLTCATDGVTLNFFTLGCNATPTTVDCDDFCTNKGAESGECVMVQ